MAANFICYEKVSDTIGRITATANVLDHEAYAAMLREQGELFVMMPLDGSTGYVMLDGDHVDFASRPKIAAQWSETIIEPMEPTVLSEDIPPCDIAVYGPLGGVLKHPGGPVTLQFVIPGEYEVAFEAFPYLMMYSKFVVAFKNTGAVS